jgi:hypothetical protein
MTETNNTAKYAIFSETIEFFDNTKSEGRGGYCTVTELKERMAAGKKVSRHTQVGRAVDSLEDAKVLMRAAELGNGYCDDPYLTSDEDTRIRTRKIVKIEEVA